MSRMKTMALTVGAGLAALGASVLGASTKQVVEPADRRERRRQRRQGARTRFRPVWARYSRHRPHQGIQERARRIRQIREGKLQVTGGARG